MLGRGRWHNIFLFFLHVATSIVAYGAVASAGTLAILLSWQHAKLKERPLTPLIAALPPLDARAAVGARLARLARDRVDRVRARRVLVHRGRPSVPVLGAKVAQLVALARRLDDVRGEVLDVHAARRVLLELHLVDSIANCISSSLASIRKKEKRLIDLEV
mgnify:CR=1 FL=1